MALLWKLYCRGNSKITSNIIINIISRSNMKWSSCVPKRGLFSNKQNTSTFFRTFFTFFKRPNAVKLKQIDGIPENYELIYRNGMDRYLSGAQLVTLISAVVVCLVVSFSDEYQRQPEIWKESYPKPMDDEGLIYTGIFILLFVILQATVLRMPIRIYSLEEKHKYIFIFYGKLPATKERVTCTIKDISKMETKNILPWGEFKYNIHNKKQGIILLDNYFRSPSDLNIMIGYQKPPEYKN